MVSPAFSIFTFLLIAQRALADDGSRNTNATQNGEPSIQLAEMLTVFRRIHHDVVDAHLTFMLFAASYGDRVYRVPAPLSADCRRTAAAASLVLQKLALVQEAFEAVFAAVDATSRDLQKRADLPEHPLEPLCRRIEQRFANSSLSGAFEEAKQRPVDVETGPRPPYLGELVESEELLFAKMIEASSRPQMAKLMALLTFRNVVRGSRTASREATAFVRACRDMAKEARFADAMQAIFEKTMADLVPLIGVDDRVRKYNSALAANRRSAGFWWVPNMTQIFGDYVAKDAILKREADSRAATM